MDELCKQNAAKNKLTLMGGFMLANDSMGLFDDSSFGVKKA
ncbi:MAG: hypothetical protein OXC62_00535 [Aestuariivita sp.]|nr:hypothetical protein [Aestuariivita sp.]